MSIFQNIKKKIFQEKDGKPGSIVIDENKEKKQEKPKSPREKEKTARKNEAKESNITSPKTTKTRKYQISRNILIKPLITEKVSMIGQYHQYAFVVPINANKIEIAHAIENMYHVRPIKITTARYSGKVVRYGKNYGKTKAWKKAFISLNQNDKIELFEGV